ncbi:hypothetical protein MTO96_027958 [Rhipicephalus appendiculatus]
MPRLTRKAPSSTAAGFGAGRLDLAELFLGVSEPPPVPLYSQSQADALSAFGKQWPDNTAHIVRTIVECRFQGPMKRLQKYVCEQWRLAEMTEAEPQPLESATSEPPVLQQAEETSRPSNPLLSAPQESAIPNTPVAEEPRQELRSNPAVGGPGEDVTSMPTTIATQNMFVLPSQGEFDPNCTRLLTWSKGSENAVPCLLGFMELVGGADFQKVLNSARKDGLVVEQMKFSSAELRQRLADPFSDVRPAATTDDFYVLLGILLCNLSLPRGFDVNDGWYETRVNDLVGLFPDVSGDVSPYFYEEEQADAISAFAEQWPATRAAICSIILKGTFTGPMKRLQQYVSASWRFAGMEDAKRILEFLVIRNTWVLGVIPELKSRDPFLKEFLQVYKRLGADGPYMKLLHLPEAAKALREPLALHAAAAYALALQEDWTQFTGVPQDQAEDEVFVKVSTMVYRRLGTAPGVPDASGVGATALNNYDDQRPLLWKH